MEITGIISVFENFRALLIRLVKSWLIWNGIASTEGSLSYLISAFFSEISRSKSSITSLTI
jgi:hypothetical protein